MNTAECYRPNRIGSVIWQSLENSSVSSDLINYLPFNATPRYLEILRFVGQQIALVFNGEE